MSEEGDTAPLRLAFNLFDSETGTFPWERLGSLPVGFDCHASTAATKRDGSTDLCGRSAHGAVGRSRAAHHVPGNRSIYGHLSQRDIRPRRTGTSPRPARAGVRMRSLQSV